MTERNPQILNASTNLLGICFVVITGLKLTGSNDKSFADEIAWLAAFAFLLATLMSYLVIRAGKSVRLRAACAEISFIAGILLLFASVLVAAVFIRG